MSRIPEPDQGTVSRRPTDKSVDDGPGAVNPVHEVGRLDALTVVGILAIAAVTAAVFDPVAGVLFGLFLGGALGLFLRARELEW